MKKIILMLSLLIVTTLAFCADRSDLKFRFVRTELDFNGSIPDDCEKITVYDDIQKNEFVVEKEVVLDGSCISSMKLEKSTYIPNDYELTLTLNQQGTDIFAEVTANNLGRKLLAEIDGNSIFCATILQPIHSGVVCVSGIKNFIAFKKINEIFNFTDRLPVDISALEFESCNAYQKDFPNVDLRDPQAVASAFLHYYGKNDSKWKDFVRDQHGYRKRNIAKLEDERKYQYSNIDSYELFVEKLPKPVKKAPFQILPGNDEIDSSIMIRFKNSEHESIQSLRLILNSKGEYYVAGF